MSGNYVRKLGQEVFKNAGLLNLQRIFMNNCHVQVSKLAWALYRVTEQLVRNLPLASKQKFWPDLSWPGQAKAEILF